MNFFLGIRTIALIHGNDGGLRRDSVECALSGSCRGRRKENLYEGSWREFESVRQIHNSDNRTTRRRSVVDLSRCATRKSARPFSSKLGEGSVSNAIPGEQILSRTLEQRRNPFS